jgi:hypothetical protein
MRVLPHRLFRWRPGGLGLGRAGAGAASQRQQPPVTTPSHRARSAPAALLMGPSRPGTLARRCRCPFRCTADRRTRSFLRPEPAINDLAEQHTLLVACPERTSAMYSSGFWNLFHPVGDHTDRGEPAAGQVGITRALPEECGVDSSGGRHRAVDGCRGSCARSRDVRW